MADDTGGPVVAGAGPRHPAALTPEQTYVRAVRRAEQAVRSWRSEVHHQTIVLAERKARRNMGADVGNSVAATRAALEKAKATLAKREQRLRYLQDNPPEPPSAAALNQARIAELVDLLAQPPAPVTGTQPMGGPDAGDGRHRASGGRAGQRELLASTPAAEATGEAAGATDDTAAGDEPAAGHESAGEPGGGSRGGGSRGWASPAPDASSPPRRGQRLRRRGRCRPGSGPGALARSRLPRPARGRHGGGRIGLAGCRHPGAVRPPAPWPAAARRNRRVGRAAGIERTANAAGRRFVAGGGGATKSVQRFGDVPCRSGKAGQHAGRDPPPRANDR